MSLLKFEELYKTHITKDLQKKFSYANSMMLPKLSKICINMSDGDASSDSKVVESIMSNLSLISGQRPAITRVRKSNASFKIRQNMAIGCKVTLRKQRMYDFIERLVLIALPRIRDFRGFSIKNFDGNGNLSFGIKEQIIFPEIDYDKIDKVRGLDITIVTTASDNKEAMELLKGFHIPFIEA
jgi:large subunit ribosomal protein L5